MSVHKILIGVLLCVTLVSSRPEGLKEIIRKNITFVIHDAPSMYGVIDQLVDRLDNSHTLKLLNSNRPVDKFILVTFNDKSAKVRTVTDDRQVFINALASVKTDAEGSDGPGYAFSGIKAAWEQSVGATVVFTDSSPKDPEVFEELKNLVGQQRSQISILLMGTLGFEKATGYQVYYNLVPSYQITVVEKKELSNMFTVILGTLENSTKAKQSFPAGDSHKFEYTASAEEKEIFISVKGSGKPTVGVTGPDGQPAAKQVLDASVMAVFKVADVKPGTYTIEITSAFGTTVTIDVL